MSTFELTIEHLAVLVNAIAVASSKNPLPTQEITMLARFSAWCFDHRLTVLGLWVAALLALYGAAGIAGTAYDGAFEIPDSESADGLVVLEQHFADLGAGGLSGTIVFRADQGIDDPEVVAAMEALFATIDAGLVDDSGTPRHPGATVISPYSPAGQGQIASSGPLAGELAYAQVNLAPDVDQTESARLGTAIAEAAPEIPGLEVLPGGLALAPFEEPETEFIGLAFAVVVLILAFGSVLAMGLPIAVAVGGVGAGIASIMLLSNLVVIPDFTGTLGAMIGLGVGIDYALFIVTRYREGTEGGRSPREATVAALDTAGRSVVFAGLTVVVSLLGMLLMGLRFVTGLAVGASVTVLVTMIGSVTLLPALLGLFQDRIEVTRWRGLIMAGFAAVALLGIGIGAGALAAFGGIAMVATLAASWVIPVLRSTVPRGRSRPTSERFAYRWSRTIQRHPLAWFVSGLVLLLVLAAPILHLRLGFSDEGNYPPGTATREAYDLLAEGFGPGFNGPLQITVIPGDDAPPGAVAALASSLAATDGVAQVTPPFPDDPAAPEAFVLGLIPTTTPQADATAELVTELRNNVIPAATSGMDLDVKVTGMTATNIDFADYLGGRVLVFFGAVLAASFVLLTLVFRSLLVPLKAVVMNVLSIAAAYGVVVAVFQWGWMGAVLGVGGAPIEPYVPMMLFAIVFGLSMDYEVFLLSRVREHYLRSGDAGSSVADGLAATARIITAAAAIMIVVFGSFLFEDSRVIKLFGLGLALAVFLDATLVRMMLVPATMELLGDRNWWVPRWLDRILPRLDVDGIAEHPTGGSSEGTVDGERSSEPQPSPDRPLVDA